MRWNPQSREIIMERNLSTKTGEIRSKDHTRDSRKLNPRSNGKSDLPKRHLDFERREKMAKLFKSTGGKVTQN
jgi:hypothetical protein